jgi:ubiquinone/menaquinone biosynthesis C-methylase UbiE
MMLKILHRLVSNPWLYDLSQSIAGKHIVEKRMYAHLPGTQGVGLVILDLGGGTGSYRELWPEQTTFLCLDIEMPKLRGFAAKFPQDQPLLGDATHIPLQDHSVDYIQCTLVTHHLTDDQLLAVLAESKRVLKPEGQFVFLDAVWNPGRWRGRILWSLDRGSHPRRKEDILKLFQQFFIISTSQSFAVHHEYLIIVAH